MAVSSPDRPEFTESLVGIGSSPMMEAIGICHVCIHRRQAFPATCAAFPDGIPDEILVGDFNHTEPYPGDRGIRFEKKGLR